VQSIPLPLKAMLNEYFQLANRIRKHYISPGVILCFVTGRFVPPIHRKNLYSLQYSMLPARRVDISALWELLSKKRKEGMGGSIANGVNGSWNNHMKRPTGNGTVTARRR
jgi:phosphatidylinositol N-acetylglucosaminyltransferase subunit Q